ncbi:ATP-dependent Clp protease ATP-binding subunit [Thermocoleostomius sinensis]|uniref:ATP-dependent Clp protease ATP-binding subunit n=1 Tax=Thermocoleostomius sinensis A174 TaxID=2016057 RepID=A0A9E8ZDD5_9CYAN|nr:ATP-dependent Clp protease ATP-binding subunit [Thermocoleostomius sinensis]WAL59787.1 ATP-dependent Clp protease ATP-binding subunit [Thermocoleostomius sinensis A174]
MFEYFTEQAIAVIMAAQEEARRLGYRSAGTEQLLLGLLRGKGTTAAKLLTDLGVTLEAARSEVKNLMGRSHNAALTEIPFTPKSVRVLEQATVLAQQNQSYVTPEHLLLSILEDDNNIALKVLENLGVDLVQLLEQVSQAIEAAPVAAGVRERSQAPQAKRSSLRTLDEFGRDLTQLAAQGQLDPMVGRQLELERVVQILGRRTKNNPVLVGEPGVGKTAIAEGLAQRIHDGNVPDILRDKQVISLDVGTLLSGTRLRGEFEERMSKIVEEVRQAGNIILVIDEIHTLVGAGATEGSLDAANMLKPALARGEFQVLGATTLDEYRKYIERDAALERRFQPVTVGEPSVEETIAILHGLRDRYEQHHRVTITDEALDAAAKLSHRYIADRFLPDKAIDLIDEAGSLVRLRQAQHSPVRSLKQELSQIATDKQAAVDAQDFEQAGKLRDRELELEAQIKAILSSTDTTPSDAASVTADDIAHIVSEWTRIPVTKLTESTSALLLHLEDALHDRVIGQEVAVSAVARAIRRARVGLKNPERPIASLIFAGPTGVGKTELTKALAATVFGSEDAMIRLDMSEYMEAHTVSKLIGSPPGYVGYDEGGQLTEAVRRQPYTVILLDEIEKAHPDVFNMLLQLLEDGRLTDAKGRTVSFKNTLLIMTSNIGSKLIEKGGGGLGFELTDDRANTQYQHIRTRVQDEMKHYFRPELLNRIDEIIVFQPLTRDELQQIADLLLKEVDDRLSEQAIRIEVTDAFKEQLIQEGYNPSYGARPLRRAIARLLEDNLAEAILAGQVSMGETAIVDIDNDGNVQIQRKPVPAVTEVA